MFRVTGMRSWNLNADDFEAMTRFYRDVLGGEERGHQTIGGADVVRLRFGEQGIGLFDAGGGPRPGIPHHTFACEGPADPAALQHELEGQGVKVDPMVRRHGDGPGYSMYVEDPNGNRIELAVTPA